MIDNAGRIAAAQTPSPIPEFYTVELAKLFDGKIRVALTATTIDEEEPQLLNQEIATEQVTTIDDALALVRANVLFS